MATKTRIQKPATPAATRAAWALHHERVYGAARTAAVIDRETGLPDLLDAAEMVHAANRDLCFCLDTKGRGLGQCVWCELRAAIAKAKGEVKP